MRQFIIYIYTHISLLKSGKQPLSWRCLSTWSSRSFRPAFASCVLALAGTTRFKPKWNPLHKGFERCSGWTWRSLNEEQTLITHRNMILPIPDAPCMEYVYLHLGHFWGFYVGKYSSTMVRIWVVKNIKDGLRWWFSSSHPVNVPRCASGTCPGRFPGKVCARTLSSLRHLKPGFLKICWKAMGFHRWTVEKSWFP